MAEIRDLAGATDRNRANDWWWIVDGLDPGEDYELLVATSDATFLCHEEPEDAGALAFLFCHDQDVYPYTGTANADGVYVLHFTELVAKTYSLYVYLTSKNGAKVDVIDPCCYPPATNRLNDPVFTYVINSDTAQDTAYVDAGTLAATPGDAEIALDWDDATTAIVEPGDIVYKVWRSTSGEPVGQTLVASGLTSSSYLDTGLTNGLTYRYRVVAEFLLDAYATPVGSDFYSRNRTNVVEAMAEGAVPVPSFASAGKFPRT